MICVSMDHLHFYVYEYSEKQKKRTQNFYNNTKRTDRIAASTKKHALKTREVQAQTVQKSNSVT